MVSRTSYRRWLLRDLPQTYMVFGCTALIVGILIYSIDWSPLQHETAVRPQSDIGNNEQRYTGSIILPVHGKRCWEGMFDNRTGKMIEKGYVDCDEAAHQLAGKNSPQGMDALRLRSVGKAFRHEGD